MPRQHYYRHLDDEPHAHRLTVELTTREVAERIVDLNHGTHRLLSHLVDVRRERLAERIATYRARGDHDIADGVEKRGDELAEAIAALLERALY